MTAVQDRADTLAEALEKLSTAAALRATSPLRSQLIDIQRDLTALWVRLFGSITAKPENGNQSAEFVTEVAHRLGLLARPGVIDPDHAAVAWLSAYAAGVDHALGTAPEIPDGLSTRDQAPPLDMDRHISRAVQRAIASVYTTRIDGDGFVAVQGALVTARVAVSRVEAAIAAHVTSAASEAVRDVARNTGAEIIWVAERDGCAHCLAYSGETTAIGVFPHGLTFADEPLRPHGLLMGPPLHPHCRCVLDCWDPSDTAVVTALKREARRSVLKGWRTPTESEGVRLRAAGRLLNEGAALPKTVEDQAARAVRRGSFRNGRRS
jgi:hypothetical protein